MRYEVRDIDQTAEIAALKAERDEYVQMWRAGCDDRSTLSKEVEELRAALAKIMEDAGNPYFVRTIARRALDQTKNAD